jgi:hypothetical protein
MSGGIRSRRFLAPMVLTFDSQNEGLWNGKGG